MKWKLPNWLIAAVRGIFALAAAALLILQVLLSLHVYQNPIWVPITIAAAVAIQTLMTNLRGTVQAATKARRAGVQKRIQKYVIAATAIIAQKAELDMLTVGLSVFRARRRVRFQRAWPPLAKKWQLYRIVRFRLNDTPPPTTVKWTEGKGVIGECLLQRRWAYRNWSPIVQAHSADEAIAETTFEGLSARDRSGFTYNEFVGIMHKYAEILAVPVMSEGGAEILGVVAVDRPYDAAKTQPVLNTNQVREAAEMAAAAIREELPAAPILDA